MSDLATREQIQDFIDDQPIGTDDLLAYEPGTPVDPPKVGPEPAYLKRGVIELGENPLVVPSYQQLIGVGPYTTIFDYTGQGAPVRISCKADHGYAARITLKGFGVRSKFGGGVALDCVMEDGKPSPTTNNPKYYGAINESAFITLEDLAFTTALTPIVLRSVNPDPEKRVTYFPRVLNVGFDNCGGASCIIDGIGMKVVSPNLSGTPRLTEPRVQADFILKGTGAIYDARVEGKRGRALLSLGSLKDPGDFTLLNNYNEPGTTGDQIIINRCKVVTDRIYFVSPNKRVVLKNGSALTCLNWLDAQDEGGKHYSPSALDYAANLKRCYVCDASSFVRFGGKVLVGKEPVS